MDSYKVGIQGPPSLPSSMYIYLGQREKDCSFTSTSGLCSVEATYFNGTMDDFRVYNRALSESEVQELYNNNDNIATIPSTDLSCNLMAYYPFSGNANDESGNGYNGVVHGASMTTDRHGNTNGAYVFDGVDDYVLISDMGSQPSSITLSEWFKINSLTSTSQSIIAIQDSSTPISGYHYTPVGIYAGEITGSLWNIGNIIGQTLKTNTWYHAVLTYDSSKKVQKYI